MRKILIICLLMLYQGCITSPETPNKSSIEQRFLFEVMYSNYAWGFQLRGMSIDNQGRVYQYDHSHEAWQPSNPGYYTEEELRRKFESNKEFVETVDDEVLQEMYALIKPASEGSLSKPVNRCADAGTTAYLAYLFDSKANAYKPVLLYQAGDWAQKNLSGSARVLYEWLFTFEGWSPGGCPP